jgi:hypothetical protein
VQVCIIDYRILKLTILSKLKGKQYNQMELRIEIALQIDKVCWIVIFTDFCSLHRPENSWTMKSVKGPLIIARYGAASILRWYEDPWRF